MYMYTYIGMWGGQSSCTNGKEEGPITGGDSADTHIYDIQYSPTHAPMLFAFAKLSWNVS